MLTVYVAEHVYEGNWIKQYMDHLYDNFFKISPATEQTDCQNELNMFGKKVSIATPDIKAPASNYSEALMKNLGTTFTAQQRLAVFPQEQNQVKNYVGLHLPGTLLNLSTLTDLDQIIDVRWIQFLQELQSRHNKC
jgi:hypothetical protein